MLLLVKLGLNFMLPRERLVWLTLSAARSLLAVLDLAGVLAIGWVVTSTAMFLVEGSDPLRVISLGSVSLPTATAANLPIATLSNDHSPPHSGKHPHSMGMALSLIHI